jgi:3-oxoacyl-[acyl-carrier-protein] synthase-3
VIKAQITGIEHYVPEKVLSNFDLEKMVDTNDEWIVSRTGIRERHIVDKGVGASDLLFPAAQALLKKRGISAEEIDMIIIGTITPDHVFPSTACMLQAKLGAKNAWGFDVSAACSGFLYAMATGSSFIETGRYKKILVCGVDVMSSIIDYEDRATCIIFGDGCGVALLEPTDENDNHIMDYKLHADGTGSQYLNMKAGGSIHPASIETVTNKEHYVFQDGKQVFKSAVTEMANVSADIMEQNGFSGDDLTLFVPHQANLRIVEAAAKRLSLPPEKVIVNLDRYGNTTAGTIPICLSEAQKEGRIKKGDLVLLSAFGGGYTWGSMLLRWAY